MALDYQQVAGEKQAKELYRRMVPATKEDEGIVCYSFVRNCV
jgi:hypothetical protein